MSNKTVEEILMSDTAVYDYKIRIYDEQGRFMCAVDETVYVERTKFPEEDRANAVLQVYNLADAYLEEYDGEEYTVQLTDVG